MAQALPITRGAETSVSLRFFDSLLVKWGAQREAQGKRPKDYKIFAVRLVRNCIGQDDRSWTHMRHRAASHVAVAKLVSASVQASSFMCISLPEL